VHLLALLTAGAQSIFDRKRISLPTNAVGLRNLILRKKGVRMKRFVMAWLAFLVTLSVPIHVQAIPIVSVGSATVTVGNIFTIPVSITDAVDLRSFQFDLSFGASILQVTPTGVTESPFFTQGNITVFVPGIVDNTNGNILGVADALIFQPSVNGSGVLANIEFQAIGVGTSPLTLSNVFLNDLDSGFAVTNGSVCVNPLRGNTCATGGGTVPEPDTIALLLAAALGLLTWRRRTSTR
jgi:hypothetical protein